MNPFASNSKYHNSFQRMRIAALIAGILFGLIFIGSSVVVLFKLMPTPPKPENTPPAHFMAAFVPTGYMTFVKVLELLGGILVAIPRTRILGLLVLGPILVNILAFHAFVTGGHGLFEPMLMGIVVLAIFLLWVERRAFANLVTRRTNA
jgi:putative oxidoreductase